jgi:tol-pal system protein YbgF
MEARPFLFSVVLPVAAFALGCAANAAESQISDLNEEVARIQESRDRADGDDPIEPERPATPRKRRAPSAAVPAAPEAAHVTRISPDGSEEDQASAETASSSEMADTEDTTPRPTIRVSGYPRPSGRRAVGRGDDQIEELVPEDASPSAGASVRTGTPRVSALDPEARRAYDTALALVNGKQYEQALEAFAAFLVKWPDHPYAENAIFWRGECYFARGEYLRAVEQFEGVLARFQTGNKAPDSLLKLGFCHQKLGNPAKAKSYFEQLVHDFPRSEAAHRMPRDPGVTPAPQSSQPQQEVR